jgi:hypothetical protein
MTRHLSSGSTPVSSRYLRPDANRYVRSDAMRFIRPDIARVLVPGTIIPDVLPVIDLKYRTDQRRIPAGQPGGGRWVDMLASLIWGVPLSNANNERDDDGGEADEPRRADARDDAYRNAHAELSSIAEVDKGEATSGSDELRGEDDLLKLELDPTPTDADDTTALTDPDDPLPIVPVAQRSRSFTDKYGDPYYSPGGHHEMPQSTFRKWELPPETRRVFDEATTGSLPTDTFRTNPDGVPQGHFWNGPDGAHGRYNQAVNELSEKFLSDRNIRPNQMTPDQAWELLAEIRESADPRIRGYNDSLRLLRRLRILRTGRGSQ